MEEIRSIVRKDPKFRQEARQLVNEALSTNLVTKDELIKINIVKCKELEFAVKVAGEAIESYETQLEIDENIITELKDKIGDNKITTAIIDKHKDKVITISEQNKYKDKGISRLKQLATKHLSDNK